MPEYEIINHRIMKNGLRKDYLANYLSITDVYFNMILHGKKNLSKDKLSKLYLYLDTCEKIKTNLRYVV